MPEGDSIFRLAARLRVAALGRVVTEAESRATGSFSRLVGDTLTAIETHGKNLFFGFASGLVVHSHLRMQGSWRVYLHAEGPRRPREFRALLVFEDRSLVCSRAPIVRLLSAREAERARSPTAIGGDPLHETFDASIVVEKLRGRPLSLAEALLDQRAMAGVGNILKSETLFVAGIDPFASCASCTDETLLRIVETAAKLLRASVAKKGDASIDDDSAPFRAPVRQTRAVHDPWVASSTRESLWVYGKRGEPCPSCSGPIEMRSSGYPARSTYFCPRCQAGHVARAAAEAPELAQRLSRSVSARARRPRGRI